MPPPMPGAAAEPFRHYELMPAWHGFRLFCCSHPRRTPDIILATGAPLLPMPAPTCARRPILLSFGPWSMIPDPATTWNCAKGRSPTELGTGPRSSRHFAEPAAAPEHIGDSRRVPFAPQLRLGPTEDGNGIEAKGEAWGTRSVVAHHSGAAPIPMRRIDPTPARAMEDLG